MATIVKQPREEAQRKMRPFCDRTVKDRKKTLNRAYIRCGKCHKLF